jgi:histidinol phosphatase-like enzyme
VAGQQESEAEPLNKRILTCLVEGVAVNQAVFWDRDGTIMKDVHYCSRAEDVVLLGTVEAGLRKLAQSPFLVILITNPSGIASGIFFERTLQEING